MAYNGGFPATYQPLYYQPQYQPVVQQSQAQQNNGIIWVQGEAGAKSYLVAPNTTVQLWDSETQRIFLKSADASGMPSMKILEYTICNQAPQNAPLKAPSADPIANSDYATKAEFAALQDEINVLKEDLKKLTKKGGNSDE